MPALAAVAALLMLAGICRVGSTSVAFNISVLHTFPTARTGRLLVYFAVTNGTGAPPFQQASDEQNTAQVFGFDSPVHWSEGDLAFMPTNTFGYPLSSINLLDPQVCFSGCQTPVRWVHLEARVWMCNRPTVGQQEPTTIFVGAVAAAAMLVRQGQVRFLRLLTQSPCHRPRTMCRQN